MTSEILTLNGLLKLMDSRIKDTVIVGIYSNKVSHDRVLNDEMSKYFDYLHFSENSYYLDQAIWNRVNHIYHFNDTHYYGDFFIKFLIEDNGNLQPKPTTVCEVLTETDCEELQNVLLYDFGLSLNEESRENILKFLSGENVEFYGYNFVAKKHLILVHMGY